MPNASFTAEILSASARGLSNLAAERLISRTSTRLADGALAGWSEHLDGRLGELVLALREDRPATFLEQLAWAKVAFVSRSLPVDALRVSLDCLHEVVAEELPSDVGSPALQLLDEARGAFDALEGAVSVGLEGSSPTDQLTARYILTALEGGRREATELVLDAVRSGSLSVSDALLDVVMRAQRELGRMWHANELSVVEEHVVSSVTNRLVGLLAALGSAAPSNGRTVLLAALEDDEHDMGVRVLAELFDLDGWRCVVAGGRLPPSELPFAIERFGVDVLLLSATLAGHRLKVLDAVRRLREDDGPGSDLPILVGGPAFGPGVSTELLREVGAGSVRASEAVAAARALLGLDDG